MTGYTVIARTANRMVIYGPFARQDAKRAKEMVRRLHPQAKVRVQPLLGLAGLESE